MIANIYVPLWPLARTFERSPRLPSGYNVVRPNIDFDRGVLARAALARLDETRKGAA